MILGSIDPLFSLSGFLVGIIVGMTGVGGGALMTPILVLLFGVHPATAVGTDLLYAALTKSAGSVVHGMKRTVDWRVTGLLAAGSVPAAASTILVLALVGKSQDTARLISVVLGYALLATAATFLFRRQILAWARRLRSDAGRDVGADARLTLTTIGTGVALGVVVSLSSVGAGALGVTALLLIYPHLPVARIVGSDIAHAVPLTLVAGAGHWMIGGVDWVMLAALLLGSVPGIVIGSHLTSRVPEALLRGLLAGVLTVVGLKLAFG